MKNELTVFNNPEFGEIRTLVIDNEPYFVGKDVAKILGYAEPRSAVSKKVDDEDKGVAKMETPSGMQDMTIINESGLYSLILSSKLPTAKQFKRWVTSEVLPSIRKHGIYATDNVVNDILVNPDFGIQLLSQLKQEREEKEKLKTQNLKQNQIIEELRVKADYTDVILQSKSLVTITQIAKDYGMTGTKMNELLHKLKVQYKQNGQWLLYSKHQAKGYTHSETIHFTHSDGREDIQMITKWTQKGRLFLYELLKESGILPKIEQDSAA